MPNATTRLISRGRRRVLPSRRMDHLKAVHANDASRLKASIHGAQLHHPYIPCIIIAVPKRSQYRCPMIRWWSSITDCGIVAWFAVPNVRAVPVRLIGLFFAGGFPTNDIVSVVMFIDSSTTPRRCSKSAWFATTPASRKQGALIPTSSPPR